MLQQKLLISCRISSVEFLGSLKYTTISSAVVTFDFFLSNFYPFDLLFCPIALAKISSTMLNRYGESRQPCLVPDFSGIVTNFSLFSLMLATGWLYIAFITFRYGTQIPDHSKTFIMKGYWIFSNAFSASDEMFMCFFFNL